MKQHGVKLLIVSFDAVGDRVFERLRVLPHTGAFLERAAVARKVRSVFLTNTYPVHTSVITGVPPSRHGLVANEEAFPTRHGEWNYRASLIGAKTLWQAAFEKGLSVASGLWPVTGGASEIRWNLPEIMPRPGDNQVLLNLKHGSKLMQMGMFLRHRRLLDGINQPAVDRFTAASMVDVLRRHKPDLALVHFTAYDALCHRYGEDFDKLDEALHVMDDGFGAFLGAVTDETAVILFSDHAQLPLDQTLTPNDLLVELGLMQQDAAGTYRPAESGCFFECAGGSAFFHAGTVDERHAALVRQRLAESPGFNRFLTPEEMAECGSAGRAFGFCALPGSDYEAYDHGERGQHGYPADYDGFRVFYAARAPSIPHGALVEGGSLLDLAPLALRLLAESLAPASAPVLPGLPPARADFFHGR
ncbi:MAG: ectonucleotide pyrophosphatase/phosphodiesterase [Treponema sp.]|jgi:predicted AlkP superfamily pyrophosphatase or phosphodiesterase|nr:ectonucleotide pyrophosphatase/phosphodiesterase [Treponema sp.]